MRLFELLSEVTYVEIIGSTDFEVSGLAYDSRLVDKGDLFFCIRGHKTDGHNYAVYAEEKGAAVLVVETPLADIGITQVVVEDSRKAMAQISSAFFGNPTRKLKLIGITGTNGKTTTAFMIERILRSAGHKTGLLGTIECRIGDEVLPVERTTPESLDLQSIFARMVEAGVGFAVMEVSSHAIDLMRVEACEFDAVAFTNLSQDHLDYHGTMDDYFAVKRRIFDDTMQCGTAHIINIDDQFGRRLLSTDYEKRWRYSAKDKAELNAEGVNLRTDGSTFRLETLKGEVTVSIRMPGMYNVSNALAAAGAAMAVGIELDKVKEGLEELEIVPGRFERVDCGQDFDVIVDYAHTPDSLDKVLRASRELTGGRLIALFGCGGDRDVGKRPLMGRIAVELSDHVVVTSDNPRSEDPEKIIEDIVEGIRMTTGGTFDVVEDRRSAIRKAIACAQKNDFVVIAGKGHETGQEIAGKKTPFDDVMVTMELLKEMRP